MIPKSLEEIRISDCKRDKIFEYVTISEFPKIVSNEITRVIDEFKQTINLKYIQPLIAANNEYEAKKNEFYRAHNLPNAIMMTTITSSKLPDMLWQKIQRL